MGNGELGNSRAATDCSPSRDYGPPRVVVVLGTGMETEEGTCGGMWDKRSEKTTIFEYTEHETHVYTSAKL